MNEPEIDDRKLLEGIPCFECPDFHKKKCNFSNCEKFVIYKQKEDDKEPKIRSKGAKFDKLDSAGVFVNGDKSKQEITNSQISYLGTKIIDGTSLDRIKKLLAESKVFKPKERVKKKQFLTFLECTHIAKIASMSGDPNRVNIFTGIKRRMIKFGKYLRNKKGLGFDISGNTTTPKKFKSRLGL